MSGADKSNVDHLLDNKLILKKDFFHKPCLLSKDIQRTIKTIAYKTGKLFENIANKQLAKLEIKLIATNYVLY